MHGDILRNSVCMCMYIYTYACICTFIFKGHSQHEVGTMVYHKPFLVLPVKFSSTNEMVFIIIEHIYFYSNACHEILIAERDITHTAAQEFLVNLRIKM